MGKAGSLCVFCIVDWKQLQGIESWDIEPPSRQLIITWPERKKKKSHFVVHSEKCSVSYTSVCYKYLGWVGVRVTQ